MPPRWMIAEMRNLKTLMMTLKSIMFEPRRSIIKILSNGIKGTNEIYKALQEMGINIPKSTLYYHLSTLEDMGIIEMTGYREKSGSAPEKLWKLKVRKIGMNIVTGEIFQE